MLIQQAVFTSLRNVRSAGYSLVADSGALAAEDRRELTRWGPSHDSLLEDAPDASSVNFHSLPSGAFCISKTVAAGAEYSARGGSRIYTQYLLVPAEGLARFANNPFALLTALRARGALQIHEHVPDRLEPIPLSGRASIVDARLLEKLHEDQQADWVAAVIQVALSADSAVVVGAGQAEAVLPALFTCLPQSWRTAYPFTTGLKYSPSRPFRLFVVTDEATRKRQIVRQTDAALLDPQQPPRVESGWALFVRAAIRSGQFSLLTEHLSQLADNCTPAQLHQQGHRLLEQLTYQAGAAHGDDASIEPRPPQPPTECSTSPTAATTPVVKPQSTGTVTESSTYPRLAGDACREPARWLGIANPAALEALERLDDAVFDAITGQALSTDDICALWSEVQRQVGQPLVLESREKYVQHALRVWRSCVEGDDVHDPATAVRAVEIIAALFEA